MQMNRSRTVETAMLTADEPDTNRLPWHKRLSHGKIDQLYRYTISQSEPTSEYAIVDLLMMNAQVSLLGSSTGAGDHANGSKKSKSDACRRARILETNILLSLLMTDPTKADLWMEWTEELALHYSVDVPVGDKFIAILTEKFVHLPQTADILDMLGYESTSSTGDSLSTTDELDIGDSRAEIEDEVPEDLPRLSSPKRTRLSQIGRRASELLHKTKCGLDVESTLTGNGARYSLPSAPIQSSSQGKPHQSSSAITMAMVSPKKRKTTTDLTVILETPPKVCPQVQVPSRSSTPGCSQAINSLSLE